jgi:GT2 family glycosyltransferase
MQLKLSVIIVSYNSEDFIEKCLKSVLKYLTMDGEVIVVDNASTDKTLERINNCGSRIKVIKNRENLGFSKANNIGAKEASGEYLFFLNPDTEITELTFEELINFYEKTPGCGLVAPKLIMSDGRIQPSISKLPTVWRAFKEYVLGIKNAYSEYVPENELPSEVERIYGAALLIKKDFFESISGFDERYFLYYEDADLCKRIRKTGKRIYIYPQVSINHLVGGTKSETDKYILNYESSKKYHGVFGVFILQLIFLIPRLRRHL